MLITHKLRKGETFATVMKKHGVTDWKTSWDLPQNKPLKAKRKFADQVQEGDTLTFVDPRAKLHKVVLAGKTYHIPEGDFAEMCDEVQKLIKKKALPALVKLKAAYDADYEFMMDITAGKDGTIWGIVACAVENLKDARPPVKEMNAVAKGISGLQRLISSGADFSEQLKALNALQKAADDYVYAAELYRSKMIKGNEASVVLLDLTVTGLFIVVSALASGGLGLVARAFSSTEIGAAVGAAAAFVKAAALEIGESLAGNERTAGQITYHMVSETLWGGASSLASSWLRNSKIGTRINGYLASKVREHFPDFVDRLMVRGGLQTWDMSKKVFDSLTEAQIADLVVKTLMRCGASAIVKATVAVTEAKQFSEALFDAAKTVLGEATGKEKPDAIADRIAASLATSEVFDAICAALLGDVKAGLVARLEEAADKAAEDAAQKRRKAA